MMALGLSALPDMVAGHASWQRPHSTQASKSSRRFQENSSNFEMPRLSASSMFSILAMAPRGPSLEKKMLSGVVSRCMKYVRGRSAMNTNTTAAWKSQVPR
jgi:hypothetical protein